MKMSTDAANSVRTPRHEPLERSSFPALDPLDRLIRFRPQGRGARQREPRAPGVVTAAQDFSQAFSMIMPLSMSKPPCGVWPPTFCVVRVEPVAEGGNQRAALLVEHRLHLPDVGLALGLVGLGARVGEQLLELLVLPVRLVPGRIGRRRRPRASASPPAGRPSSSRRTAPFSQTLSKKPSAGSFFTSTLMPAFAALAWNSVAMIDRAVERRVRRLQHDLRIGDSRLLEMEGGLVRIVLALRQLAVEIGVGARDRVIVAERAVAAEQRLEHLLAVGGVIRAPCGCRDCRKGALSTCIARTVNQPPGARTTSILGVLESSATALWSTRLIASTWPEISALRRAEPSLITVTSAPSSQPRPSFQ